MDVSSLIKLDGLTLFGGKRNRYAHGYVSGKMAIMLKKSPGSEMVEYALKVPEIPSRTKAA